MIASCCLAKGGAGREVGLKKIDKSKMQNYMRARAG